MDARTPDADEILAQTRWVSRLALALTGDAARGDDLAQDTLAAALARPPRVTGQGGLRAWLGSVLRRRAWAEHGRAIRRAQGERAMARAGAAPSPAEVLGLEEARAALVRRVLALPVDQREAILLRYFEELPAVEVARRLGVPASTVRSRTLRGLATLRGQLAADSPDDWRGTCAALVPAGVLSLSRSPWIEGGLVMAGKVKLTVAAVLVAAGAWWMWPAPQGAAAVGADGVAPAIAGPSAQAELAGSAPARAPGEPDPTPSARSAATTRVPEGFAELVFGSVRSTDGDPITDGWVSIVDRHGVDRSATLDARAAYSLHGIAPGVHGLRAGGSGFLPLEGVELEVLATGEPQRHDLTLAPSWSVAVRVVTEQGQLLENGAEESALGRTGLVAVATLDPPGESLPLTTGRYESFGVGRYRGRSRVPSGADTGIPPTATGVLEVLHDGPVHVSLVLRSVVIATEVVAPGAAEVSFEVGETPVADRLGRVTLRVVEAATGLPIEGARVSITTSSSGGGGQATGADGRVTLERLTPGWMELDIRAEGLELFRQLVVVEPGATLELGDLAVLPAVEVSLRVLDEAGQPLAGVRLSYSPLHLVDCAGAFALRYGGTTAEDGRITFRVARARVLLYPNTSDWAANGIPVDAREDDGVERDVVLPRGRRLALDFVGGHRPGLQYLVRTAGGDPIRAGDLRRSGPVPVSLTDGRYRLELWSGPRLLDSMAFEVDGATERVEVRY